MPTYVSLIWTDKGVADFKSTVDRIEAEKALAATSAGSIKEIYWTAGPYDIVVISEAPDDERGSIRAHARGPGQRAQHDDVCVLGRRDAQHHRQGGLETQPGGVADG